MKVRIIPVERRGWWILKSRRFYGTWEELDPNTMQPYNKHRPDGPWYTGGSRHFAASADELITKAEREAVDEVKRRNQKSNSNFIFNITEDWFSVR